MNIYKLKPCAGGLVTDTFRGGHGYEYIYRGRISYYLCMVHPHEGLPGLLIYTGEMSLVYLLNGSQKKKRGLLGSRDNIYN